MTVTDSNAAGAEFVDSTEFNFQPSTMPLQTAREDPQEGSVDRYIGGTLSKEAGEAWYWGQVELKDSTGKTQLFRDVNRDLYEEAIRQFTLDLQVVYVDVQGKQYEDHGDQRTVYLPEGGLKLDEIEEHTRFHGYHDSNPPSR